MVESTFERWWQDIGRGYDPDTEVVPWYYKCIPWYYKRKGLAKEAFRAGIAQAMADREKVDCVTKTGGKIEEVCKLPNTYTLYRRVNEAGGYTYLTDEISGVFTVVWDTCLTDQSTLLAALTEEARRYWLERVTKTLTGELP